MISYLIKFDFISPKASKRIHFGDNASQKTVIGCICSMLVVSGFLLIASLQGYYILRGVNPSIEELKKPWDYRNQETNDIEEFHYYDGFPLYF